MTKQLHSSFWLDDESIDVLDSLNTVDTIQLAKYQRVISNFVRILTKKSIPVEYKSRGDSYTDSHKIVIGSKIDSNKFDSVVGLALHEGSHIKLTDFSTLYNIHTLITELGYSETDKDYCSVNGSVLKSLLNYVEDRRIDYYVYTNSPGYKGYYEALYDRYFRDRVIDKALLSDEHTDITPESYLFRIINFINKNTNLNALPGLDTIYNLIFSNVSSIESTKESLDIAVKVLLEIKKNVESQPTQDSSDGSESTNSDNGDDGSSREVSSSKGDEQSDTDSPSNNGSFEPTEELTSAQKAQLPKKFEKQRKFLEGDIQKGSLSKQQKEEVDLFSSTNMDVVQVEYDSQWIGQKSKVDVVVIEGLNEKTLRIVEASRQLLRTYDYYNVNNGVSYYKDYFDDKMRNVLEGIRLGKRLGKKLQVRNYEKNTVLTRKKRGRIEQRRLHAIGAGDYNVFFQNVVEKHTDAFLHLSIDASSSMNGTAFDNSLQSAIAIAQMGTMTNIDVQISLRFTDSFSKNVKPVMWIIYDSRKDTMSNLKKYAMFLQPNGTTPEGLCFESIQKLLPVGNDSLKTYFINYSDGMPYFPGSNYGGEVAIKHTNKQVQELQSKGYNVLSFFLEHKNDRHSPKNDFINMYGKTSSFIDVTSINKLVKELQTMFINEK
jgi:hypothetical protein